MSIEVMKQALEALETIADEVFSPYDNELGEAIIALRTAIAEAEKQEQKPMHPEMRKMWEDYFDKCFRERFPLTPEQAERLEKEPTKIFGPGLGEMLNSAGFYKAEKQEPVAWLTETGTVWRTRGKDTDVPLYTTPPQRQPLTDEQLDQIYSAHHDEYGYSLGKGWEYERAIERKHGIGGGE